ncbi:MAG: heme-copper oxidase subunit III [Silvibacterium sp.]|nr:heme-copper oxidase subunit III [Silvibacterium sp.]MBV8436744.1 heme-copper oxidase subunit III [Silvibacterium sp.]
MNAIPLVATSPEQEWHLPYKGRIGMYGLIIAESAIFTIFVIAYIYYIGKSLYGPTPQQVLDVPIVNTICLLSSSITIFLSERAIERNNLKTFGLWWAATIALGAIFLIGTGIEWHKLIYHDGLTISTNLFGTTFYSLVGLHATHVVVGLIMLTIVLLFTLTGHVKHEHSERVQVLALYWHFVDAVWVVVFTVVYIVGR